ncbi:MAG: hypothetical protein Q9217_003964 [Psora testacea]
MAGGRGHRDCWMGGASAMKHEASGPQVPSLFLHQPYHHCQLKAEDNPTVGADSDRHWREVEALTAKHRRYNLSIQRARKATCKAIAQVRPQLTRAFQSPLMSPTFKVLFPLPGRRPNSSAHHTSPRSQSSPSTRSEGDGSPLSYPGSKAERLLGSIEFDRGELRKKQSKKERKSLRKCPSFMSVTLADTDSERGRQEEGFPFPGMKSPSEVCRQNTPALSRQGSSPLLGEHYAAGATNPDYFSTPSSQPDRRAESSTTLRSYYDKSKAPLLVSQQTSSSSARDLALRKGMPQLSSPLSRSVLADSKSKETGMSHLRELSADSKVSEGSKVSASSIIAGTPRRRPSVIDPPTLYPNAPQTFHAVSPPPAFIDISLSKPLCPTDPLSKRSRWWQRSKADHSSLTPSVEAKSSYDPEASNQRLSTGKASLRKPKTGSRNWFDGLDEDDLHVKHRQEPQQQEVRRQHLAENRGLPLSISEILGQGSRPAPNTQRKSSFSSKSGPSDRKLSFHINSVTSRGVIRNSSCPIPTSGSTTTTAMGGNICEKSPRSTGSSKGISANIDLHVSSVLYLSSSDDDEDNTLTAQRESSHRGHRIRASVERADYGDDILIGSAQRVQQVRPRPVVNKHSRRPLSKRSNSSEIVPPVPEIPSRPHLGQRNSSLRWRGMMEEKSITTTDAGEASSTVESGENSTTNIDTPLSSPVSTRTTSTSRKRMSSFRGSKLMKVTSEEEKLLEAMREKRASIRHNDFQKGFNKAMRLQAGAELFAPRPQTASVDGRASFRRSSSLYDPRHSSRGGSRCSVSPPPMLTSARYEHETKPSLAFLGAGNNRMSVSTDKLHELDSEAYSFPQVPEIVRPSLHPDVSAGKPSPSLSFSPSDILPSTRSTRNSPLTPSPGHDGSIGRITSGVPSIEKTLSKTKGKLLGTGRKGHERKRTVSNNVVMFGENEGSVVQADEEGEIVRWAMGSF